MYKYAVYGNKNFTALQVARKRLLNLNECIFCSDGKEEAEYCKIINPELEIIKPWKNRKEYLEWQIQETLPGKQRKK